MAARTEGSRGTDSDTVQIPRDQWGTFLDQFSEFNQATTARVEVVGGESGGSQIMVEDRPLLDVTLDDEAGPALVIVECEDTGGGSPAGNRHIIHEPTAIWARKTEPAGWDALEIESRDEGKTVVTINPHPGRGDLDLENVGRSETRIP
ncbi:MAG TPA: DUF5335 family protein [Armatimonadota bacterium]|nr:DUF5335 family protein [Armatimonadota bacterium]